jgi:RNA polymerase sigma factor for flagellar operon FliA
LEREFLALLPEIERIVRFVARRYQLSATEIDDFAGHVKLTLIQDDYRVLRKFQGRSSVRTYLTSVISRLCLDLRNSQWGKWRPSAEARRAGPLAIRLEQLLDRDGHTISEAYELMASASAGALDRREFEQLVERLPRRGRREFEPIEFAGDLPAYSAKADAQVEDRERQRVRNVLKATVATLEAQERLLLVMRFDDGRKMAEIAAILGINQKTLYARTERLLQRLRKRLVAAGIDGPSVTSLFKDS